MTVRKVRSVDGSDKLNGAKYHFKMWVGLPVCHADVSLGNEIIVENNGHYQEGGWLNHDCRVRSGGLIGDVTAVKFSDPYTSGLADGLRGRYGRFQILPEVVSFFNELGRQEVIDASHQLALCGRNFATQPHFAAAATSGSWNTRRKVIPHLTTRVRLAHHVDQAFFYPFSGVTLDPNWFMMYIQNIRPPSVQTVQDALTAGQS